jgi:hypothetical protein
MGIFNNIMEKVKTKFNGTSPTNIEQQSKIDNALSNNKTITINSPKSERYTYLPGTAGKWLEKCDWVTFGDVR